MWQQDIRKTEWVMAVCTGTGFGLLIVYLFYNSIKAVFIVIPVCYFYMKEWIKVSCKKKSDIFKKHFSVAITIMTASLKVGYSYENALVEAVKELEVLYGSSSTCFKEFTRIRHLITMNVPIEQAMEEMALRVDHEDVTNFVTVFIAAKRSGGDAVSIMDETVRQMNDRLETQEEISTALSSGKLEFKIMCLVPAVILLYMRSVFSEFMTILYGNILGCTFMSICLAAYICAYIVGKKIINIEV